MTRTQNKQAQALRKAEKALAKAKATVVKLKRSGAKEPVMDYVFRNHANEPVRLSQLFGHKKELILVHNMGRQCRYCTLWADGFTGLTKHLQDRAAFALESADSPKVQKAFYQSRGWNFNMCSSEGSTFKQDMGFADAERGPMPGVSVFVKKNGKILRTASDGFGPGDDYCAAWHFLDLLPGGARGWQPQYRYGAKAGK
jgi:predicted dithiol-disulfide oxidoreductase (DUF899 family)